MMKTVLLLDDENKLVSVNIDVSCGERAGKKFRGGDHVVQIENRMSRFDDCRFERTFDSGAIVHVAVKFFRTSNGYIVKCQRCSDNEEIYVPEKNLRDATDREVDMLTKYPDTLALRSYLMNGMTVTSKGRRKNSVVSVRVNAIGEEVRTPTNTGLCRHLHIDDFKKQFGTTYGFQIYGDYSHYATQVIYIDLDYTGGRHGFNRQETFDRYRYYRDEHPYANRKMLGGGNMGGAFMLEPEPFDFNNFFKGYYDERDPIYVKLDHDRIDSTSMWDPVADVVRVEKIIGNTTFLSNYICDIRSYQQITGELYVKWRLSSMV